MGAYNNSLISHPRGPCVILRHDYIAIITARLDELEKTYSEKQVKCAAKLLAVFEYWSNWKLDKEEVDAIMEEAEPEQAYLEELDPAPVKEGYGPWIWKAIRSHAKPEYDLIHDLMGEHKRTAISAGLEILIALDYLAVRRNPNFSYDHVRQYALHCTAVQRDIDNLANAKNRAPKREKSRSQTRKIALRSAKNRAPKREKSRSEARKIALRSAKNRATIPESTTETTTETKPPSSTTESRRPPQKQPPPSTPPPIDDGDDGPSHAVNSVLSKILHECGITRNEKTAPLFENKNLTPENVRTTVERARQVPNAANPIGLAIHWLLNGEIAKGEKADGPDTKPLTPEELRKKWLGQYA